MHDLIIVGGGAAGFAAASYALEKQLDVLLIYPVLGKAGITQHLAGFDEPEPLVGAEAVRMLERRVVREADRVIRDQVTDISPITGGLQVATRHHAEEQCRALIIATGATAMTLNVPGAQELLNYGLGYSMTTHLHLLARRHVAVVGGTARVVRGIRELARVAAQIYAIVPRTSRQDSSIVTAVQHLPHVTVLDGYEVMGIVGTTAVEQITVRHDGDTRRLAVDAVFVDLGLVPNSLMVQELVETDSQGFIRIDARHATTCPGIFAAGDVTTGRCEQMLIAAGDGVQAAQSAYDYILAQLLDQMT